MSDEKKKKGFLWRRYYRDGKGVDKKDVIKGYSTKNFFRLYFRRITNLMTINLLYIFGNFPILFFILAISGLFGRVSTTPESLLFPILNGIKTAGGESPALTVLFGIAGVTDAVYAPSTATYIFYGISALSIFTFGLVNVGCTYLIRETVRGEHIFVFSDFFSAIKRNFGQGVLFGIIDLILLAMCFYADWSYLVNYSSYTILFFCSVAMTLIYLFARTYMYIMIVTFDLKFGQIIKNSFIFSILGLGRNFGAALICVALVLLTFFSATVFVPIGIIITILLLFATMTYVTLYIEYPKVEKLMIEPYYEQHPESRPDSSEEDEPHSSYLD